jgi:ABC-type multidrug transport system fused ATPase/permease subunit
MREIQIQHLLKRRILVLIILSRAVMAAFNVVISILIQIALTQSLQHHYVKLWLSIASMLLSSLCYVLVFYLAGRLLETAKQEMNLALADRVALSYLQDGNQLSSGQATNLLMQDAPNLIAYFQYAVLPLVDFALTVALGLLYVGSQSLLMLLVFLLFGAGAAALSAMLYRRQKPEQDAVMQIDDEHKTFFEQMVKMVPVIRNLAILPYIFGNHSAYFTKKQPHLRAYAQTAGILAGIFSGGVYFVEIVLLLLGYALVDGHTMTMPAMLGAWNAGVGSILWPMISLPSAIGYFVRQRSSAVRFTQALSTASVEQPEVMSPLAGKLTLQVQNVTYTYPEKQIPVLKDLNLQISSSGMTFITASNGKGKTTLFNLVLGNLHPDHGQVRVTNGREFAAAGAYTAYVPQVNVITSDTLRHNLVFDRAVSDGQLRATLLAVNMGTFGNQLENQLDLDELSGGQKRRIGIARALLSEQPFVLLDEPFSDIDAESQRDVMSALRNAATHRGIIVITHTQDMIDPRDQVIGW